MPCKTKVISSDTIIAEQRFGMHNYVSYSASQSLRKEHIESSSPDSILDAITANKFMLNASVDINL